MVPYVALQQQIIDWLFAELRKTEGEVFVRKIAQDARSLDESGLDEEKYYELRSLLNVHGLFLPTWEWHRGEHDLQEAVVKILLQQIDDEDLEKIVVRNLLGLNSLRGEGYSLEEWVKHRGSGFNRLRTPHAAQPGALKVGDRLITGETVIDGPREGGNGTVYIHLNGRVGGVWLGLPSRIPVALLTPEEEVSGLVEE